MLIRRRPLFGRSKFLGEFSADPSYRYFPMGRPSLAEIKKIAIELRTHFPWMRTGNLGGKIPYGANSLCLRCCYMRLGFILFSRSILRFITMGIADIEIIKRQ